MAEDDAAELRALRERAYGAAADIGDDPAALARLRALEERLGSGTARETTLDPETAAGGGELSGSERGVLDRAARPAPRPPRTAPRGVVRLVKRLPFLWAATTLLAVGVAVAVTIAILTTATRVLPPPAAGSERVAVLQEDPRFAYGSYFQRSQSVGFEPFEGLLAVSTTYGLPPDEGVPCLLVLAASSYRGEGIDGTIQSGCRAGSFPATAQLIVNAESPAPLRERFTDGTALQFVLSLDGGSVAVLIAP